MERETIYFAFVAAPLLVFGGILLIKSMKNKSKSLKAGIIFPFLLALFAFLMMFIGHLIYVIFFLALPLSMDKTFD